MDEEFKIFDEYDVSSIEVRDPALKPYINVKGKLVLKSQGRNLGKFGKAQVNIIERIASRLQVPGHLGGKKHKIITSWSSGKYTKNMKTMLEAMKLIENKTKQNPVQIIVTAIENGSPKDEITVIEHGGARYPQAVDSSPTRRVDLAVRWLVQGAYNKSFGKKKKMSESLANEIILTSQENMDSFAMQKKNDAEKQADSAR